MAPSAAGCGGCRDLALAPAAAVIWRWPAIALMTLLALSLVWTAGFTAYNHDVRVAAARPPHADGIVVLTGGADRIRTGLRLFTDGLAPVLLVSGVGRGSDLAELARQVSLDPAPLADHVTLGHVATTTIGNAAETASWAHAHGVRRLIVVTAGYHMPRALLELSRSLPGVQLFPVPVQPPALRRRMDFATIRLLATEYDKLVAVRLGLNTLLGARS